MSKRVTITPQLQQTIRAAIGDPEADTSRFAVFEAKLVSTEPLTKGGIFNKARISASTIVEMETKMKKEGSAIPLHIMHNDRVLPVGRLFSAKVFPLGNGETELRGQFMIPLDKKELVSDIENSVVDEVSVGILTKSILCSECGFDYRGPDATLMNFFDCECNEGHKIGVDGIHTRLVGLDDFMELSLVGDGAAHNPKILPRVKQNMSKEMGEKLAASKTLEACILQASYKMENSSKTETNEGDSEMDDKILAQLTATTSELATAKLERDQANTKVTDLTAQVSTLTASNKEANDKLAALEAGKADSVKEVEAKLAKAEKELADATAIVAPHVKAALVASGVPETEIPAELSAQVKLVEEKGLKLHQIIGAGAKTEGTEVTASKDDPRKEAFKLNK